MRLGGARAVSGKKAAAATRGGGAVEAGPCLHSGGRVRTRNPARRRRRRHDGHGAFRGEFLGERRLSGTPRASASSRGLRARRAAALEASEREFAGPGAARPSSPRGPRLSGQRFPSGLAAAQGAGAGSAARQPRRGLQGPAAPGGAGGQSADGACAASGAGSRASCGGLLPAAQALDPARSRCAAGRAGHFLPGARLGSWGCAQDFASRPAHKARASRLARTFLILPTPLLPAPRCACVQSLCAGNGKDA